MSRLTTTPMQLMPELAYGHLLTAGGPTEGWIDGDWVEFFSLTTAPITIAGVVLQAGVGWSQVQWEIEFGIGDVDVEVPIGHFRLHSPNSGNGSPTSYILETPVTGIGVGVRVCGRLRSKSALISLYVNAIYYENFDSSQAMPYSYVRLTSLPAGVDSPTITPSGTPWTDSAPVEVDPAVGKPTYIVGLAHSNKAQDVDQEFDILIGAIGDEVLLTTLRTGTRASGTGRLNVVNLPGLFPVDAGSRVSVLERHTGTDTQLIDVALLVYMGSVPVIGPLVWVEWPRRVS